MNESLQQETSIVKTLEHIKCVVCKEEIIFEAKKCIHCDSFQDWRRHFQFNVVVLSLLVALFSVVTTSVPVIQSVVLPQAAMRFSFLHFRSGNIMIVATNTGRRAAVLNKAIMSMETRVNSSRRQVSLAVRGEAGKKEIIIDPDKWTVLALSSVNPEDSFSLLEPADYRNCQIEFSTLDLNHKSTSTAIDVDCKKAVREDAR